MVTVKRGRGRPRLGGATHTMGVVVPTNVYKLLVAAAKTAGKTVSALTRDALIEWLTAHASGQPTIAGRKRKAQ